MPEIPGPKGPAQTGGRQRCTPNRKTHELAEKLGKLGCDPIAGRAQIAIAPESVAEPKVRRYPELPPYNHDRRRAVEQASDCKQEIVVTVERIGT